MKYVLFTCYTSVNKTIDYNCLLVDNYVKTNFSLYILIIFYYYTYRLTNVLVSIKFKGRQVRGQI